MPPHFTAGLARIAGLEREERTSSGFTKSLGFQWPCRLTAEFGDLWPEIIMELEEKGIGPAPRFNGGMTAMPSFCAGDMVSDSSPETKKGR